jgi:hypothetical protein
MSEQDQAARDRETARALYEAWLEEPLLEGYDDWQLVDSFATALAAARREAERERDEARDLAGIELREAAGQRILTARERERADRAEAALAIKDAEIVAARRESAQEVWRGLRQSINPCKPDIFAATYEPVYPTQGEGVRDEGWHCPRVAARIPCEACGYPPSEAREGYYDSYPEIEHA